MQVRNHDTGETATHSADVAAKLLGVDVETLMHDVEESGRCDTDTHTAWEGDSDDEFPPDADRDDDER